MKTIGVKLPNDSALNFQEAAESYGLTVSAAIAALLSVATDGFTNFSVLATIEPRKRGRPLQKGAGAVKDLTELVEAGWTIEEVWTNRGELDRLILEVRANGADKAD